MFASHASATINKKVILAANWHRRQQGKSFLVGLLFRATHTHTDTYTDTHTNTCANLCKWKLHCISRAPVELPSVDNVTYTQRECAALESEANTENHFARSISALLSLFVPSFRQRHYASWQPYCRLGSTPVPWGAPFRWLYAVGRGCWMEPASGAWLALCL